MKKIAFIMHGKIKKQDKIIAGIKAAFDNTAHLVFASTQHIDHASELAWHAANDGATHIICLGGDGSLNEVMNGIMRAMEADSALRGISVGLLPYGTGNDFARTMCVTKDVTLLRQCMDEDSYRWIDLCHAKYQAANGIMANRYFINITDVGIGGVIAMKLAHASKIFGPTITYQKEILKALLTYKNQPVRVRADGFEYEGNIMSLIVANGRYFGGGMGIAPHALPDDNLFSVVVIGAISMFDYLMNLGNIKKLKKIEHPQVRYLTTRQIVIEPVGGPLPIDMDGEFAGYAPVTMQIVPNAIKFIGPK